MLDKPCKEVQVSGKANIIDTCDVAFVSMKYDDDVFCNLHLSWLDPLKVRDTIVVGTKQMVVCDSIDKTIKLYNKSANYDTLESFANESYAAHLMTYTYGDMIMPFIEFKEPMYDECMNFVNSIEGKTVPKADCNMGLEVVETITAMNRSYRNGGTWEQVRP